MGHATSQKLSKRTPLDVRYAFGVVRTPAGFGRVKSIRDLGDEQVQLTDEEGKQVVARADVTSRGGRLDLNWLGGHTVWQNEMTN